MLQDYNHPADEPLIRRLAADKAWATVFEALAQPLHEALYNEGSFELLERLHPAERLILSLDYVQMQVGQGGFIQLIQNGYVSLLITVIETAQNLGVAVELCRTLDDALKVYVLNNESLSRETSPQEFARLYGEFQEFEALDDAFNNHIMNALRDIVRFVLN